MGQARAARPIRRTILAAMALAACAAAPEPGPPSSLIPAPAELTQGAGGFVVRAGTPIVAAPSDPDARWIGEYLSDLTARTRGLTLPVRGSGRGIVIRLVDDQSLAAEAYRLNVTPHGVVIEARERAGLYYGVATLWQLMTATAEGPALIPALRIEDRPRFRWRGMMLDSARHYQSPQFIRAFIDVMALHKLNVLHWHLTDDQAWRLEIRRYPRLTEIGAWRVPAGAGRNDIDPATGRPRLYGGYYSQDEVREIVAYAAARNVTIVPEIEMPGHASAAIAAYPELGVLDDPPRETPADWGVYPNLYNVEEPTFQFLENVLVEVMELFPGQYIHVGGDEAVKTQWERSPRVQARMRALGVADEHALQSYFIQRMERFLAGHGRRLIGWDEILEGGLAPNATVMSWRGVDGAVTAARAGHDAVLAAWPTLYFDNRQSASVNEPPGRGRIVSVESVYAFDPAPDSLTPAEQAHILGLQGNLWSEHIRTEPRMWRMALPRAAAIAELGWSPAERIGWADFSRRLPAQMARYDMLGLPEPPPLSAPAANVRRSQELETCADKLVLSLEDDAPVRGERAVFLIDIMQPCWLWRGVDLSQVETLRAGVGQVPFNFQIGEEVNAIRFRRPATRAGELEVRLGCEGERIAVLPLAPAARAPGVAALAPVQLAQSEGVADLCFTFTQRGVDPMYAIDWIALDPVSGAP
ncbi:MAG TPA: family 20 glycosylhydrolase [Vitreimonas sp.]|uniref:family 20 glycosylhydrolase n=1 Tax=Vitreimonas sp. TaxID=3069702 RepID=UPI002D389300|nr:family 20 glycosylhydrolase [Vitreimonas sp.]HYD86749.1 family 20 glycosylhydrolase [Vitreimonas sp.]